MCSISTGIFIMSCVFLGLVLITFFNEKVVKLPSEIGLMSIALILSLVVLVLEALNITSISTVLAQIHRLDFHDIIINGFLCFLLFSGSATIKLRDLTHDKLLIASLAFISTFISTMIYAGLALLIARFVHVPLNFIEACILGSIVSPTDPISAMSILKKAGLPERLSIIMEGESLFNDGLAVALFVTFTSLLHKSSGNVSIIFIKIVGWNVFGALAVGIIVSAVLFQFFKRTKQKHLEVIISLAAVTLSYSISEQIEVSGPTAAVVVGIFFATQMSKLHDNNEVYYANFYTFWKVIDKILNAVLYILIGVAVLFLHKIDGFIITSITAIFMGLLSRYLSIILPIYLFSRNSNVSPEIYSHDVRKRDRKAMANLLSWSGLKGGICIALALGTKSIFDPVQFNFVVTSVYAIVVFSTLVQGLTVNKVYHIVEKDLY